MRDEVASHYETNHLGWHIIQAVCRCSVHSRDYLYNGTLGHRSGPRVSIKHLIWYGVELKSDIEQNQE